MAMEIVVCVVLLLIGVVVLIFIHVCIVGRVFRRTNGVNREGFNPTRFNTDRISSMSQEDIKKLPCFEYKLEDVEDQQRVSSGGPLECAVCLENFKIGDKCRVLPKCNHCFHAQCIEPWLISTGACPICRAAAKSSPFRRIGEESSNSDEIGIELT